MRILVAGSVPPPAEGHRAALLDGVVRLRREGHDVEVLSVDHLAAAHRYTSAPGLLSAIEVGITARRFDAVVVQIEPGLPVRASAGRAERALALIAFALLLRRIPDVTLRLDRPLDLPGGPGGRAGLGLWRTARLIEIGPEVDSDALAILLPDGRDRLKDVGPGSAIPIVAPDEAWSDDIVGSAVQVNEVIRRRAAATRQALGHVGAPPSPGAQQVVRVEQWEWLAAPKLGVPDFGQLRDAASSRRATAGSIRVLAAQGVALAERHEATRPVAQLARFALSQVRAATRAR